MLCDRKKFLNLKIKSNDFRLCIELPFRINYLNYNYCSFPSYEYKRQYGKKNVNEFKDGFLILLETVFLGKTISYLLQLLIY